MARGADTRPGEIERATLAIIERQMSDSGYSQRAFAPLVGISHGRLSKMFKGESTLTVTELAKMCEVLGLDLARVIRTAEASVEPIEPMVEPGYTIVRVPADGIERIDRSRPGHGAVRK